GAYRIATAQRLGKNGEVRADSKILLRTSQRQAEAGDDLVKNQSNAVLVAQGPHSLQKAFFGYNTAVVAHHRFGDDRGDFPVASGKCFFQQVQIVPGEYNELVSGSFGKS